MSPESHLVYDSDSGRLDQCPTCHKRSDRCVCGTRSSSPRSASGGQKASVPNDGIVRVQRDRKNRGGKVVTVVTGLPTTHDALGQIATELKRGCGTGGTVKDGRVEIQGDHRERTAGLLRDRGFTVKLAGG